MVWLWSGHGLGMVWLYDLAMIWPWSGYDLAMIWLWSGYDLAMIWLWSGYDLATIWLRSGYDPAPEAAVHVLCPKLALLPTPQAGPQGARTHEAVPRQEPAHGSRRGRPRSHLDGGKHPAVGGAGHLVQARCPRLLRRAAARDAPGAAVA